MTTEREMKEALDGRFFWFDHSNERVGCSLVPKDYIPSHRTTSDEDALAESGRKGGMAERRGWTQAEDEKLIELRGEGLRWQHIARRMGRGDKAARLRYLALCKARGMTPVKCSKAPRAVLTMHQRDEIIRLREAGYSFPEIDAELGLPDLYARNYYTRFKRAQVEQRLAA